VVRPLVRAAEVVTDKGSLSLLNAAMRRAADLNIPFLPTVGNTGLYSFQISSILDTRAWESFRSACSLQATIPQCHEMIFGDPAYRFTSGRGFSPKALYPGLQYYTKKQACNYFLARNNRLFIQEMKRLHRIVWPQVKQELPTIQTLSTSFAQPLDPLEWMAQRVLTPERKKLFLGEVHNFPEIQQQILEFLIRLRQLDNRPMIILTEFLPEGYEWKMPEKPLLPLEKGYYKQHDVPRYLQEDYRMIWDELASYDFRIIGMEPSRVLYDESTVRVLTSDNAIVKQEIWATLEGMKLRNQKWQQTIDKYSKENPNALIIVYTGAAHSLYNAPFSIAPKEITKENFVLAFYPHQRVISRTGEDGHLFATTTSLTDPLERLTNFTVAFPQPVLFLENPQLVEAAGFDGRIKVEVDLTDRLIRLRKLLRRPMIKFYEF
jgi:hypothetical protein